MDKEQIILNNRYKLMDRAGTGGMATVYRSQDLLLGRVVAVKLLHETMTEDDEFITRFRQEAHSAANLSHPNIVTVHDIGQDGYRHYIVMEYIDGLTLKQVVRDQIKMDAYMPMNRALDFAIQVCEGIGYAHRANLVHCDIKPQNLLVTADERVKITDFGIAKAMSDATAHTASMVWGTPQYFSPEQASGKSATPASDVYSIGIILFELLTNQLPFTAESHTALALKHLRDRPPKVNSINPAVPDELAQIIDKILSKEPSGRYRTAGQLASILTNFQNSTSEATNLFAPVVPASSQTDIAVPDPYNTDGFSESVEVATENTQDNSVVVGLPDESVLEQVIDETETVDVDPSPSTAIAIEIESGAGFEDGDEPDGSTVMFELPEDDSYELSVDEPAKPEPKKIIAQAIVPEVAEVDVEKSAVIPPAPISAPIPEQISRPNRAPRIPQRVLPPEPEPIQKPKPPRVAPTEAKKPAADRTTILLGILAIIAWLGLIPFWIYISQQL